MEKLISKTKINIMLILSIVIATVLISVVMVFAVYNKDNDGDLQDTFTLSYVVGDVTNPDYFTNVEVEKLEQVEEPSNFPTQVNKYFEGWYTDEGFEKLATFPIIADKDITLYANFLDANLPKENIAYNTTSHEYFIHGVLGDISSDTLIIPDVYDDGTHGISKLTYIVNMASNRSFLTDNEQITKLYIGNNIKTINEYFAYNSKCINSVVFGRSVVEIAGTAFKLCTNINEAGFVSDGWYNVGVNDLVNCEVEWLKRNFWQVNFDTRNKLLLDAGEDGTATNYADKAFDSFKIPIIDVPQSNSDYEPDTFPTTVNYRFKCWCDDPERTNEIDFNSYIIGQDVTFYAKYQEGNLSSDMILYNGTESTLSQYGYEYMGSYYITRKLLKNTNYAGGSEMIVPDIYTDGINPVASVKYMEKDASGNYGLLNEDSKVTTLYLGNNIRYVSGYFAYLSYLTKVYFPKYIPQGELYALDYLAVASFSSCAFLAQDLDLSCEVVYNSAFYRNYELTSIKLTTNKIGQYAFYCCNKVTSIEINTEDNISIIDDYAFYNCSILKELKISGTITDIGYSAFSNNNHLEYMYWNVSNVDDYNDDDFSDNRVFYYCGKSVDGLNVVIGNKVEEIPQNFMNPNDSTTSVNITNVEFEENSVCKVIGGYAFAYCASLKSIVLPDCVEKISEHAFYESGLTNVQLNEGLEYLGVEALGDTALTEITLPSTITVMGDAVFGKVKLTTINYNITELDETHEDCFDMCPFENASGGVVVNIGANVKRIPRECFGYYASGDVEYNFDLKITGLNFAMNCQLESIGEYAFCGSDMSCDITIPSSVKTIEQYAFNYCEYIPNSVTFEAGGEVEIESYAFAHCEGVDTINFNNSVKNIGDHAFAYCIELNNVSIPSSVLLVNDYSFYGCETMSTITIDGNNEYGVIIGQYAFSNNNSVSTLELSGKILDMGEKAFSMLNGLKTFNLDAIFITDYTEGNNVFDRLANNVTSGATLNIGENITRIPTYLFTVTSSYAPKIKEIVFSDNCVLHTICEGAFSGVRTITTITIPSSVTSIEKKAFYRSSLTSISFVETTNWWACTNTSTNYWEPWAEATVATPSLNKTYLVTNGYAYKRSTTDPGA